MGVSNPKPRVCVLLPSYNNAQTLLNTVAGIRNYIADIIVINDGSTDETAVLLKSIEGIDVVQHERNRGKGAAIISGFKRAHALGFTHAITMDTDGQHDAANIPLILEAIAEDPCCIVIGDRELSGAGRAKKSRLLRKNSNFWTWVLTGQQVSDTQSGFRSYPLEAMCAMHFKKMRYDFEIEVLVIALWNDIPIRSLPVKAYYGPGSESHFRPLVDFLRVARLNIQLLVERLMLTKSIRVQLHSAALREGSWKERKLRLLKSLSLQESNTPFKISACVAIGVCCGILPVWGFQSALAVLLAKLANLSRTLTFLASNVSIPVTMPLILYMSLLTGHILFTGELDWSLSWGDMPDNWKQTYAKEYLLGSVVFAVVAGLVTGGLIFIASHVASPADDGENSEK